VAARRTADQYDAQGRHNEDFYDYLCAEVLGPRSHFSDWGFVVVFYAALHYTKAHLMREHGEWAPTHKGKYGKDGLWVEGHNDLVERRLKPAYLDYKELFDASIQARYVGMYEEGGVMFPELKRKKDTLQRIKDQIAASSS
jgi:hypothetical protein